MTRSYGVTRLGAWVVVIAAVTTFVAASAVESLAGTTLRFATLQSPKNPMIVELQKALDEITKRSGGQIKFQMHYGTEAGFKAREFVNVLKGGLLDSALIATSASAFDYPWLGVSGIPFLSRDLKTREVIMDALRPMFEEFSLQHEIVPLAYPLHVDAFLVIYSKKKSETLADIKGKLIRVYDPNSIAIVKGLGAVPVDLQKSEIYLALQKGTIDGAITGTTSVEELHFDEVCRYETVITPLLNPNIVGVSKIAWDKLPREHQALARDILKKWDKEYMAMVNAPSAEKEAFKYAIDRGMTIVEPGPDMKTAFTPIKEDVVKSFLSKGGAQGKRALDAVNEALAKVKK